MSFREIVTLQVGHYSNFVGTHMWNAQESSFNYDPAKASEKEICHDVLYREGQNLQREVTFTPRLVLLDLKGSLRTLRQQGDLYDMGIEEEVNWPGDVTMHSEDRPARNAFLKSLHKEDSRIDDDDNHDEDDDCISKDNGKTSKKKKKMAHCKESDTDRMQQDKTHSFDEQVKVWSDFLGARFHPKTIQVVQEFRHQEEYSPFDIYPLGEEVMRNYETTCEWEDRVHYFTEECDNLQGFHLLADTHNGFGGIMSGMLKYLEDEFPGKGVLAFGLTPADASDDTAQARATRIINSALAYDTACRHSSLFVPASVAKGLWRLLEPPRKYPYLDFNSSPFHTSAILAAAIDTMTLPYRLYDGAINITDITHSFNAQGRKMASLSANFPLGLYQDESLVDFLTPYVAEMNVYPWQPLTPHITNQNAPFIQSAVSRGAMFNGAQTKTDSQKLPQCFTNVKSTEETIRNFLFEKSRGSPFSLQCLKTSISTKMPFPQIFSKAISKTGYVSTSDRPDGVSVETAPVITSLQCAPDLCDLIGQLTSSASKMNIKKHHRYLSAGLEEDDFTDVLDNLNAVANCYHMYREAM
ncbi:protein misato homolog 1-like [Dreissena polymorpha]|uniref:Protein misato n=1 Tax=Dreissena polymorpha TaxID=45954 RepID=A0A9D4MU24_DREPO|nr:protein misato homolog 1-like [Dreissena polymorpha]KAH3882235.1 hypothetical protein DPMN_006169 [Dreissena polymorpha]